MRLAPVTVHVTFQLVTAATRCFTLGLGAAELAAVVFRRLVLVLSFFLLAHLAQIDDLRAHETLRLSGFLAEGVQRNDFATAVAVG